MPVRGRVGPASRRATSERPSKHLSLSSRSLDHLLAILGRLQVNLLLRLVRADTSLDALLMHPKTMPVLFRYAERHTLGGVRAAIMVAALKLLQRLRHLTAADFATHTSTTTLAFLIGKVRASSHSSLCGNSAERGATAGRLAPTSQAPHADLHARFHRRRCSFLLRAAVADAP